MTPLHLRINRRILQAAEGAQDGNAGLEQGVQLPPEQQQIDRGDFLFEQR